MTDRVDRGYLIVPAEVTGFVIYRKGAPMPTAAKSTAAEAMLWIEDQMRDLDPPAAEQPADAGTEELPSLLTDGVPVMERLRRRIGR